MPYVFNPFSGSLDNAPSTFKGDSSYTTLQSASTNWDNSYSTVQTNSSTNWDNDLANQYVHANFLPLTGGIISGTMRFNDNVTIFGDLSCTGTQTFANTVFTTTSALSVVHFGSGPAMWVGNNGDGDIASFYDIDQGIEVLHVGGINGDFPNVGVKTSAPNKDFTVNGEISASNTIWDTNGNSNNWNSVYSSYNTASAGLATNSYVNSNFLPLSGGTMTGKLNLLPSTASSVPINLGSGVIPSTTVAGDVFASGNNIWYKGTTGGPYIFAYKNDTNTFFLPQIISTASPTGDNTPALRITQAGGGEAIRVEDDTTPDSTAFIVGSNGSVGIGLSSLSGIDSKLTVVGNISSTGVVYASGGISNQWNSTYTTVSSNSANWQSTYTNYSTNSALYVKTVSTNTAGTSAISTIVAVSAIPAIQEIGTLYILI